MIELAVGALITFVEPGTTTGLCGRVFHVGEGAGGVPTVWAVQQDSGRGFKAPAADVKPGCGATPVAIPGKATVASAPPAASAAAVKTAAPSTIGR